MDINDAFASSCNGVFAQLADELGAETIAQYAKQAGLLDRYSVSGISTAAGSVALEGATSAQLGLGRRGPVPRPGQPPVP